MLKYFTPLLFIWFSIPTYSQKVEVIKWDKMEEILKQDGEKVKIVNFWATWCSPCVKEIPYFEKAHKKKEANVFLISLDNPKHIDKVEAFASKNELVSKVLLLDEVDYNSWIDKVDKNWSGALPATVVISKNSNRRYFMEGAITEKELHEKLIKINQ